MGGVVYASLRCCKSVSIQRRLVDGRFTSEDVGMAHFHFVSNENRFERALVSAHPHLRHTARG